MHLLSSRTFYSLLIAGLAAGCGAAGSATGKPGSLSGGEVLHLSAAPPAAPGERASSPETPSDADLIMELDVYQLSVPFGAVSNNDPFWRHVDEDHVRLATHDVLLRNGIRYGIGRDSDWSYFKDLIEKYGASSRPASAPPVRKGMMNLPLRGNVDEQNIFYFNPDGVLYGRTYHKCDDLLSIAYEPCPRKPGDARLDVCALIRGVRKDYKVSIYNSVRDIQYVCPEYLYDLRLSQDVPMDHFMVIAPSPESAWQDTLGHALFVRPGPAEPSETVVLLVPRPFRITGPAPAIPLERVQSAPATASAPIAGSPDASPPAGPGAALLDLPKLRK